MAEQMAIRDSVFTPFTDGLIYAAQHRLVDGKQTKRDLVLLLLSDGCWHGGWEIAKTTGSMRYGARLFELNEMGVRWCKRRDPDAPKGEVWVQYRLLREGESA